MGWGHTQKKERIVIWGDFSGGPVVQTPNFPVQGVWV